MTTLPETLIRDSPENGGTKPEALAQHFERPPTAVLWFAALLLGFLQAWHWRFSIAHGAVSLLDMGDAYLRGDRGMEVNGYVTPLFALLLGLAIHWCMEWGLLERVQIVAEVFFNSSMPSTHRNDLWRASPDVQNQILAAFVDACGKIAVPEREPPGAELAGASSRRWHRLGAADFYAHRSPSAETTVAQPENPDEPRSTGR